MEYNIPAAVVDYPMEKVDEVNTGKVCERRHFPHTITIDPEGSTDHDDALTCHSERREETGKIYTVGVHITDIQSLMMEKGSKLDEQARKRCCTVYNAPDSHMQPHASSTVSWQQPAFILGKSIKTFSVLTDFIL